MKRPICSLCNQNVCAINYKRDEVTHYRKKCDQCGAKKKKIPKVPLWHIKGYKKKSACDLCGFHSVYASQITVFHIDGNLENCEFTNLRSICLNCIEVVKRREPKWNRGDLKVDY